MLNFPYDSAILAAVGHAPATISDVIETMLAIDAACIEADGLKWFNGLYLQVTQAMKSRLDAGGFTDPAWLARLDVVFAQFYFNALAGSLGGGQVPGCWQAMFSLRGDARITRLQFALAGMNAHINHDLCQAVVATCREMDRPIQHGSACYRDYTAVDEVLEGLIDKAKQMLAVRLPGDSIPPMPQLENLIAGFDIVAAREHAWNTAEALVLLPAPVAAQLLLSINGITAALSKSLLMPII